MSWPYEPDGGWEPPMEQVRDCIRESAHRLHEYFRLDSDSLSQAMDDLRVILGGTAEIYRRQILPSRN